MEKHETEFTRRWFRNRNQNTFETHIQPEWEGKPITYLELGVFEGMSLYWMMKNILTHPDSRSVGVDPWLITTKLDQDFMDAVCLRAIHNLSPWMTEGRCILQRGNSAEILRKMNSKHGFLGIKKNSVDLCMIDGDHNSYAVLDDSEQVLPLMKRGGWMIFDDVENQIPKKDHVKQGLARFVQDHADQVEMVFKHRFVEAWRKL